MLINIFVKVKNKELIISGIMDYFSTRILLIRRLAVINVYKISLGFFKIGFAWRKIPDYQIAFTKF